MIQSLIHVDCRVESVNDCSGFIVRVSPSESCFQAVFYHAYPRFGKIWFLVVGWIDPKELAVGYPNVRDDRHFGRS
jgi:hypothetical protein